MWGGGVVQMNVMPEEIRRECQISRAGGTGERDLPDLRRSGLLEGGHHLLAPSCLTSLNSK